jgi:hypothetical protein
VLLHTTQWALINISHSNPILLGRFSMKKAGWSKTVSKFTGTQATNGKMTWRNEYDVTDVKQNCQITSVILNHLLLFIFIRLTNVVSNWLMHACAHCKYTENLEINYHNEI